MRRDKRQCADVATHERYAARQSRAAQTLPGPSQHGIRAIDTDQPDSGTRERERYPAGAASELQHRSSGLPGKVTPECHVAAAECPCVLPVVERRILVPPLEPLTRMLPAGRDGLPVPGAGAWDGGFTHFATSACAGRRQSLARDTVTSEAEPVHMLAGPRRSLASRIPPIRPARSGACGAAGPGATRIPLRQGCRRTQPA
jgi:hypothetical protein